MTTAAQRKAIETMAAEYGVTIEYTDRVSVRIAGGIHTTAESSEIGSLTLSNDLQYARVSDECHELAHAVAGHTGTDNGIESSDLTFCRVERRAALATRGLQGVYEVIQSHVGEQEALGLDETLAYHKSLLDRVERHLALYMAIAA